VFVLQNKEHLNRSPEVSINITAESCSESSNVEIDKTDTCGIVRVAIGWMLVTWNCEYGSRSHTCPTGNSTHLAQHWRTRLAVLV
jgi:hypothetical protein